MNLDTLSDLELMAVHKAIHERVIKLERDLKWYERMSERNPDYITKFAVADTEYRTLISIRKLTSEELTLRNYRTNLAHKK